MSYVIFELTELEDKLLAHIAYDPQDWIENVVAHQVMLCKDEVVEMELARMIADPNTKEMPSDRDKIVENANLVPARIRLQQEQQ